MTVAISRLAIHTALAERVTRLAPRVCFSEDVYGLGEVAVEAAGVDDGVAHAAVL
jgi:hypothetical protein